MSNQLPLKGLRAIVIEDEYFLADNLKQILTKQGADAIRLSGSINDALYQLHDTTFDVALLDIDIRGDAAFSIADELLRRKVPFAFVTGYDRVLIPTKFSDIPNWGKPYDAQEIVGGIQTLWAPPIQA